MRAKGRRKGRPVTRRRVLLACWLGAGLVILARAAHVQLAEASTWKDEAEAQHQKTSPVPAPRGAILDRNGSPLAVSHERVSVAVAPREIRDAAAAEEALVEVLGLSPRDARRAVRGDDPWVPLKGWHAPSVRSRLQGIRGIHFERRVRRFYPTGGLGSALLGVVENAVGKGGVEQAFDSLLSGRAGRQVSARDGAGREIPGESWIVEPATPGGEVVLTIDRDVQEIAYEVLQQAIEETNASGGDLVVLDPKTGELLAMVSLGEGGLPTLSAINAPYEPGSTAKVFTAAGLLDRGLVRLGDSIDIGDGTWRVQGRVLHDVHPKASVLSFADAIRLSSNVGVAKAAVAFSADEQYENLRDFGFGVATGIPLVGEQSGMLRHPSSWSGQSPASLAIGYEFSVTPLQMALAYGALANRGRLMEPRLVRETRDRTGTMLKNWSPRKVRDVVSASVTDQLAAVLVDAVEDGTGKAARLSTFDVAGKSGTSRAYGPDGYQAGDYYASFVGFFPAEDPQLVILAKLDRPRGAYYGGATAGPVTRLAMESILAARGSPLDRSALAEAAHRPHMPPSPDVRFASANLTPLAQLPDPEPPVAVETDRSGYVFMPEMKGLPARVAIRRLHAHGLRVQSEASGPVIGTRPRQGTRVAVGDTVVLVTGGRRP